MSSPIYGLDHLQIASPPDSQAVARAFYGDLLGLEELEVPLPLRDRASSWFRCGALQVHIGVQPDFQPARKAHPAFLTHDLDALRDRLQAAGYATIDDHDHPAVRRFFSTDPWGNRLEFVQPKT